MVVPWDEDARACTLSRRDSPITQIWDFARTARDQYPLLLHFPYFQLYRKQVVKQADLVLALHAVWRRVHRRGEGAGLRLLRGADRPGFIALGLHAGGDRSRGRASRARLRLPRGSGTRRSARAPAPPTDGVHIASLAGAWTAAVAGFGGMRDHGGVLTFAPRLPARLERLAFRLVFCGRRLKVEVAKGEATYTLVDGASLDVGHHGETVALSKGRPVTLGVPPAPVRPAPRQPPGREPARRGAEAPLAADS